MRARRRRSNQLVPVYRNRNCRGAGSDRDKRLDGAAGVEDPGDKLDIVIVVWRVERPLVPRRQPQVRMRHRRRVPVHRIVAVRMGQRRLGETPEQRQHTRNGRHPLQALPVYVPGIRAVNLLPNYEKSIRAITIVGMAWFHASGTLSNASRKGFDSPGASFPYFFPTIETRSRSTTCPYGS